MTNTPDRKPPALKVVPPQKIKSPESERPVSVASSRETPAQESMPVPKQNGMNWGRLFLILGVMGGGVWLSQLEVPISVRGQGKLQPLPEQLQYVYLEEPGRIIDFMVQDGDRVNVGTALAQVQSQDLQDEIDAEKRTLAQEDIKLTVAREKVSVLIARETVARQQVRSNRDRMENMREDVSRFFGEVPPPEIQRIYYQIEALDSQISGLKNRMVRQDDRVENYQNEIADLQDAIDEGALSRSYLIDLNQELSLAEEELQSSEDRIQDLQAQQMALRSQISDLGERWQEELEYLENNVREEEANLAIVEQELTAAKVEQVEQLEMVNLVQAKIEDLESKQSANRQLESPISGIVFAQNLSENKGKWLDRDSPILQVANLDVLQAEIKFHQADADLIQEIINLGSAEVEIKPMQPEYETEVVEVRNMDKAMRPDPSQQSQQLVLTATVDNAEQKGLINSEFHAEVQVGKMPIYKRVQRELMKVLKLRQYF
ncbi:HlyD family efflux transporter periplasmic adaptor subunit [Roseofilum casamattae]|uniref:HlyD family efflux transporter periplasmic adaptor subunit n=1 Tax=Roseofilum casamattae BLCC-M143 TaxID=3022442 RepID=A0ABT7BXW1_9CYAN|nr:HlyD family efflux transporter periplasmic adaptor subunit [Roseofilum casamattae]MDJ1183364.1 HlyD family efflux transporter periplasmic adaptor subunit [Roseofilum casamattae BLCC-M143]